MLYPLGQEPVFATAGYALDEGTQASPLVLYPLGQEPTLGTAAAWTRAGAEAAGVDEDARQ